MSTRSRCLSEHREIRSLIRELHAQADPDLLRRDPQPSIRLLLRLGGVLQHHFAQEKEALYGRLAASTDGLIRATALVAQDDLCGLEPRVMAFVRYWTSAGRIQDEVDGYLREAAGLFRAVGRRIGQEERELLPLLEVVGA